MGASAAIRLDALGWERQYSIGLVACLFAAGGVAAFAPALILASLVGRRPEARAAATVVLLGSGTIVCVAALFALDYRQYYSAWHEPALTVGWMFQFAFTAGAAVYQFLVLGLRLYLPVGLAALLLVGLLSLLGALSGKHASARRPSNLPTDRTGP